MLTLQDRTAAAKYSAWMIYVVQATQCYLVGVSFQCSSLYQLSSTAWILSLSLTRTTRWVKFAPAVPMMAIVYGLTLCNLVDNCPRDQPAKPDRKPTRIEATSRGGFADAHRNHCTSCVNAYIWIECTCNAHSLPVTVLVWAGLYKVGRLS